MKTIAERLKFARELKGWSQSQLAIASDLSQSAIGNIEAGAREGRGSLPKIAKALDISHDWLADGFGEMARVTANLVQESPARYGAATEINLESNPEYPSIRRVRFKLSAGATGFGVEFHDDEGPPIAFQKSWFESRGYNPKKLFAVQVMNGSMEPGLHGGDTVVVNTESTAPRDGVVFAVNYEGEMVIKRLVRDAGQWWLASDNPDIRRYQRKLCDEHCIIIGEVIHKQSERI